MKTKKTIEKIDSIFSKKIRSSKKYKFHIKLLKKDIKTIKKMFEKGKIRDGHIHKAFCTAIENIFIWAIRSNRLPFSIDSFVKNYKCLLIATTLDTPEGRTALAQAMVEPIRRSLEYQALGYKLHPKDKLPEGAKATYENRTKKPRKR